MGLAAPRKRRKIRDDPNNLTWVRASDSYGRKIMCAQGWTPGSYLGARDATHASHFSNASAAPIRITQREDNLGLGAQAKSDPLDDSRALKGLQDIFDRLSGRSEIERNEKHSQWVDKNLRVYAANKWGGLNFLKGGYLIGDKIQSGQFEELEPKTVSENNPRESTHLGGEDQISHDRPLADNSRAYHSQNHVESIGEKRAEATRIDADSLQLQDAREERSRKKMERKRSKDKHDTTESSRKTYKSPKSTTAASVETDPQSTGLKAKVEQSRDEQKHRRRERREAKRALREEKRARREARKPQLSSKGKARGASEGFSETVREGAGSSTVGFSNENQPRGSTNEHVATAVSDYVASTNGRLTARQRYIQQKKRSSMDPQALREIFMITT